MLIKYVPACSSLPSLVDDLTLSPPSEHRALLSERLEQAKYIHTPPVYTVTGSHYDTWKRIMRLSLSSDLSLQITHPAQKRLATPTGGGGGGGGGLLFSNRFSSLSEETRKFNCLQMHGSHRSWKIWKVVEFKNFIFQAWEVMEFYCWSLKVIEN